MYLHVCLLVCLDRDYYYWLDLMLVVVFYSTSTYVCRKNHGLVVGLWVEWVLYKYSTWWYLLSITSVGEYLCRLRIYLVFVRWYGC